MSKYGSHLVLFVVVTLAAWSQVFASQPIVSYVYNPSTNVTRIHAICDGEQVTELLFGGRLPAVHNEDFTASYTPIKVLGQLRDSLVQIGTSQANCVLSAVRVQLGDYADTPVVSMATNIATVASVHLRGRAWTTELHCTDPCNEEWCFCEEDIPDPAPAPTPKQLSLN